MEKHALDPAEIAGVFESCPFTSLRKASRVATAIFDHATESLGLKSTQLAILVSAALHGPTTIRELAEETVMDPSSLSRALPRLEDMGLIEKAVGQSKRSRVITVTDAGYAKIKEAVPIWQGVQAQMLAAVGQNEHPVLLDLLRRAAAMEGYGIAKNGLKTNGSAGHV